jgi:starvation-inducible DNA-binding protein
VVIRAWPASGLLPEEAHFKQARRRNGIVATTGLVQRSMTMTKTKSKTRMVQTRNDLPTEARAALVEQLNQHLADLADLFTQTKQAHWNVKGKNFYSLHKLFDELAEEVEEAVDEVAERVTALGGLARGTARMAAESSRLDEFPPDVSASEQVLQVVADRYAAAAEMIRAGIGQAEEHNDAGTADLLTGIVRTLDKSLYFIESHLQS